MKKFAFTLAEVLITLGIIGVVAALTMPGLIQNHRKHVVETKLKRFYTNINQAVKLSEVENGPVEYWDMPFLSGGDVAEQSEKFYSRYFAKYLKTISSEVEHKLVYNNDGSEVISENTFFIVKFPDGSAMRFYLSNGLDIGFFPDASKKNSFAFSFNKSYSIGPKNMVEPYTFTWDGTKEHLISHPRYGCSKEAPSKAFCAKLIQVNGWKIPDDYPIKF